MSVMAVARSIGVVSEGGDAASGTIDEAVVLAALADLAAADHDNHDLFTGAAARVQLARSAGVVQRDGTSLLSSSRTGRTLQLRYRAEMADVFTDLAIDIGLREAERLVDAPT